VLIFRSSLFLVARQLWIIQERSCASCSLLALGTGQHAVRQPIVVARGSIPSIGCSWDVHESASSELLGMDRDPIPFASDSRPAKQNPPRNSYKLFAWNAKSKQMESCHLSDSDQKSSNATSASLHNMFTARPWTKSNHRIARTLDTTLATGLLLVEVDSCAD
jgi:hypothetical protein